MSVEGRLWAALAKVLAKGSKKEDSQAKPDVTEGEDTSEERLSPACHEGA